MEGFKLAIHNHGGDSEPTQGVDALDLFNGAKDCFGCLVLEQFSNVPKQISLEMDMKKGIFFTNMMSPLRMTSWYLLMSVGGILVILASMLSPGL